MPISQHRGQVVKQMPHLQAQVVLNLDPAIPCLVHPIKPVLLNQLVARQLLVAASKASVVAQVAHQCFKEVKTAWVLALDRQSLPLKTSQVAFLAAQRCLNLVNKRQTRLDPSAA